MEACVGDRTVPAWTAEAGAHRRGRSAGAASALDAISETPNRFAGVGIREILRVGLMNSFAAGRLIPPIAALEALHPAIDLRVHTNTNCVGFNGEDLTLVILFGDGTWHGTEPVLSMTPLSALTRGGWSRVPASAGPQRHTSPILADMATGKYGVALLPAGRFVRCLGSGRLMRASATEVVRGYWLTCLASRDPPQCGRPAAGIWRLRRRSDDGKVRSLGRLGAWSCASSFSCPSRVSM